MTVIVEDGAFSGGASGGIFIFLSKQLDVMLGPMLCSLHMVADLLMRLFQYHAVAVFSQDNHALVVLLLLTKLVALVPLVLPL